VEQRSKKIRVCTEAGSTIPVIVGDCPACNIGDRTLILLGYLPSFMGPAHNELFFKCVCCQEMTVRRVFEVAEE
jgi:hypothetical protein